MYEHLSDTQTVSNFNIFSCAKPSFPLNAHMFTTFLKNMRTEVITNKITNIEECVRFWQILCKAITQNQAQHFLNIYFL